MCNNFAENIRKTATHKNCLHRLRWIFCCCCFSPSNLILPSPSPHHPSQAIRLCLMDAMFPLHIVIVILCCCCCCCAFESCLNAFHFWFSCSFAWRSHGRHNVFFCTLRFFLQFFRCCRRCRLFALVDYVVVVFFSFSLSFFVVSVVFIRIGATVCSKRVPCENKPVTKLILNEREPQPSTLLVIGIIWTRTQTHRPDNKHMWLVSQL